jgi:hypothetical protein
VTTSKIRLGGYQINLSGGREGPVAGYYEQVLALWVPYSVGNLLIGVGNVLASEERLCYIWLVSQSGS